MLRTLLCAVAAALLTAAAAPAAHGVTWTPVASGTTQDILALDYQGDTRAWLATSNGQILTADANGRFVRRFDVPGFTFTDIAFRADGRAGIATTADGRAYRSLDGGISWEPLTLPLVHRGCTASGTLDAIPQLYAVAWAGDDTAYLVGGGTRPVLGPANPVVVRVTGAASAAPVAVDANWSGSACRVGQANSRISDVYAVPGNPNALRFISSYFGTVYTSNDGLATLAQATGETINEAYSAPRFAIDPDNPNRMWFVDHGDTYCNALCFTYSVAGGASKQRMTIESSPYQLRRYLFDVAYAGGTTLAVGDNGEIFASTTTGVARDVRPGGALAGHGWRAVDLADGHRALVAGTGGVLLRTTDANGVPATTPDPPAEPDPPTPPAEPDPPVTPTPPADPDPPVTPTPPADPRPPHAPPGPGPGRHPRPKPPHQRGSRPQATKPATRRAGGVRVKVWRRIELRAGRFLPIRTTAARHARMVVTVRTAGRPRRTIARHAERVRPGTVTVRVALPRDARPGRHRVSVRIVDDRSRAWRVVTVPVQLVL